ncbi:hypothetical protein MVLG_00362 [Microbotryum lychnidis-dioicae p1A1 Lamole]|uniref:Uncharacterized protein n=1 Tax=Microbotryum lychnidis-dioicae (strain p1A1 Lamole / MvSl-1064) TaxID=683840 RepID=U5GYV1_USTV1|nr:hypothetical protein MVLG_00362 [Microbotryum lychnidis-dioicae p1A1 Lamole]|eukprot:KDE09460.1 hypothetical protein MVLG_00362 [Microbotryum lychnidis-dioicae p1A1 Lamole]
MYKHVAKARRLAASNKEAVMSDESESEDDLEQDVSSQASGSGSGSEEGSEDEEEGSDEDEGEGSDDDDEQDEAEALTPPPLGYPTAEEAGKDPIVTVPREAGDTAADAEVGEDKMLCVVCPTKKIKKGRMLEVHLASKDHKRRLERFQAHIAKADFPASSLAVDARQISAQIDNLLIQRLTLQTLTGGPTPAEQSKKDKEAAASKPKSKAAEENARIKTQAELEEISKREAIRAVKREKHAKLRQAKAEKRARKRAAKKEKAIKKTMTAKELKQPKNKEKYKPKPKPSPEEIQQRQALKKVKRDADVLAAKNVPKDEVALKKEEPVKSAAKKRARDEPHKEQPKTKEASKKETSKNEQPKPVKAAPAPVVEEKKAKKPKKAKMASASEA